jgi:hypothetical protein
MPWNMSRRRLLCCLTIEAAVWPYCDRTSTNHRSQSWLILTAATRRGSTLHVNYQVSVAAVVLPIPFELPFMLRNSWPSQPTVPTHSIAFRRTAFTHQPIATAFPLPAQRNPIQIPPLYINHPKALVISEVYRYQHSYELAAYKTRIRYRGKRNISKEVWVRTWESFL